LNFFISHFFLFYLQVPQVFSASTLVPLLSAADEKHSSTPSVQQICSCIMSELDPSLKYACIFVWRAKSLFADGDQERIGGETQAREG
jgi:hypothetical protein